MQPLVKLYTKGMLLALLENIRLGLKIITMTNVLAYKVVVFMVAVKGFILLAPDIKLPMIKIINAL